MMNPNFRSGGISPYVVGGSAVIFGAMSLVMAAMPSTPSIIETGGGEGLNAIVSGATALAGYTIWQKKDTFTAWLGGALIVSLLVYGKYTVDTGRAMDVASAAGTAAISAATAATNAAANSAGGSYYQYSQPKGNGAIGGEYRALGAQESAECTSGAKWTKTPVGAQYCQQGTCPIAKCGTAGL